MKKQFFAAILAVAASGVVMAADNDPVLMTVDGRPVHISEFEYLYNKNNSQQVQKQSLDEYLQMFTDYKLKVADAEHAGLQDTPDFQNEYRNFRVELAAPYLRDNDAEEALINEAYGHRLYDVYVSHIMLANEAANEALLDSLRNEIIAGNVTFEQVARERSIDRGSSQRGGRMAYVIPDRFPWPFEKAAYDTAEGEISPVINSGMGWHIIRVESRTPAAGEVHASHILRLTRGKSDEEAAAQKTLIDSLYTVLQNGADFAAIAMQYSEDPGSARRGGDLDWFGRGAMVAEFDSTAFAMADGAISEPFGTSYGYHIIKRFEHRGVPDKSALRGKILEGMQRDGRAQEPQMAYARRMLAAHNAGLDNIGLDDVRDYIANGGGYDSTMIAKLANLNTVIAFYDGGTITVADVMPAIPATASTDAVNARNLIAGAADNLLGARVMDMEREKLMTTNADYRNLVNEYRDGILLYEIANRNVWDRANKDTEGLNNFFRMHRANYTWEKPKFKAYVFMATSDSILSEALQYAESVPTADPKEFTQELRKRFGRDIKIERVIAAEGENPITDYLGFGADKPELDKNNKWVAYGAFQGRIIDAPEDPVDMRGAVVTDYQTALEQEWVKKLRKKYKVKLNKKVFEQLKAQSADYTTMPAK